MPENKVKLSALQKNVIRKVRNGCILSAHCLPNRLWKNKKKQGVVKNSTIKSLEEKGLIKLSALSVQMGNDQYFLTDLGKSIKL